MIRITHDGNTLQVRLDIPPDLNGGKAQYYTLAANLGGSDCAVAALADRLAKDLSNRIAEIRKQAYLQGARDRAKKAVHFSGLINIALSRGGCYQG